MNCIETKKNIEALVDGELAGALKESVERHLLVCRNCCELKEEMILLSSFLQTSEIAPPSAELDEHVINAFRKHHKPVVSASWRQIFFGSMAIPKPVFAALLILATAAPWLAFQVGKINSSTVSVPPPFVVTNEIPVQIPAESPAQTVVVEVPVIKEKIVTRTVFVREQKNNKTEKVKPPDDAEQNLPSSNSVADNGFFTDVSLKGFVPTEQINAKIIKEEKKDEK